MLRPGTQRVVRTTGESIRAINAMIVAVGNNPRVMGRQLPLTMDNGFPYYEHLANGARFYPDGEHPEFSTPECLNPRDVITWDAAGQRIVQMAAEEVAAMVGYELCITKRSSDGHGHAWGCHENFCISPHLFVRLVDSKRTTAQFILATFLALRPVLTGAGKVGIEHSRRSVPFQLSQRADFIMKFQSGETLHNRALINTRNEPLANEDRFRRLHLICGDANLCQWSAYLKVGLTALLLMMLQDPDIRMPALPIFDYPEDPDSDYPDIAQMVSSDIEFQCAYPVHFCKLHGGIEGGRHDLPACDILDRYLEGMVAYVVQRTWSNAEERDMYAEIVRKAQEYLECIRSNRWQQLYGILDWPTKHTILTQYLHRRQSTWDDVHEDSDLQRRLKILGNIGYTDLSSKHGLWHRLVQKGVIVPVASDREIIHAIATPPASRASQRARLIERFVSWFKEGNWARVSFLQRKLTVTFTFSDPAGCPEPAFSELLTRCRSPFEFHAALLETPIPELQSERKQV